MTRCLAALGFAGVLLTTVGAAAVPATLPFLGELTVEGGAAFDGTVSVQASLFSVGAGGDPVWGPVDFGAVEVEGGRFVLLHGDEANPVDGTAIAPEGQRTAFNVDDFLARNNT